MNKTLVAVGTAYGLASAVCLAAGVQWAVRGNWVAGMLYVILAAVFAWGGRWRIRAVLEP